VITPAELDRIAERVADLVMERISSRPVDGLIDKREAATLLGCSIPTVERLTRSGSIPSHRVGKLRRYRASELLATKKGGRDE